MGTPLAGYFRFLGHLVIALMVLVDKMEQSWNWDIRSGFQKDGLPGPGGECHGGRGARSVQKRREAGFKSNMSRGKVERKNAWTNGCF